MNFFRTNKHNYQVSNHTDKHCRDCNFQRHRSYESILHLHNMECLEEELRYLKFNEMYIL